MSVDFASDPAPWLVVDRMLADAEGETHFVKCRIPNEGQRVGLSGVSGIFGSITLSSDRVSVRRLPAGADVRHSAPERRLVAFLSGTMEITVSDGETRSWSAGEILLATDTGTGKGHRTRAIGGPVLTVVVEIKDDVDLDAWTITADPID